MKVRGLVWLGIPVEDYASAVRFFAGTLGLELAFEEASTIELSAENGDKVQLFGQGHRYFDFCRRHSTAIVPLFEVDDLDEARAELASGGAELLGEPESDDVWTWLNFRGPDGNVYSLGTRRT
jgi:predicted enzyme related to lactoylglutathione lyase